MFLLKKNHKPEIFSRFSFQKNQPHQSSQKTRNQKFSQDFPSKKNQPHQALCPHRSFHLTQKVTCVKSNPQLNQRIKKHIASTHASCKKQIFVFLPPRTVLNSKLEMPILIFLAITPKTFKTFRSWWQSETCHKRDEAVASVKSFPPKHQIALRPSQGERRRRLALPRSAFLPLSPPS